MKNKKISLYILGIFLFLINFAHSNNEFNFDVTEIEILENGNIVKGLKEGTIKSNDGITIKAKTFLYDKKKNTLNASGNVKITDKIRLIKIDTENLFFDKKKGIIETSGKSIATTDEIIITASEFIYDINLNILKAKDNVLIKDFEKDIIINTNEVIYEKNNNKILTQGKTEAILQSKFNFKSKNIKFLRDKMELSSDNRSEILDINYFDLYEIDKFKYYIREEFLKAEGIKIVSNSNETINNRDYYEFKNGFFNLKDRSYKASNTKKHVQT